MDFRKEFPDYPETDIPTLPEGFEDTSWGNDCCPSFRNETIGLSIWIDYADPAKREFPETKRFYVFSTDDANDLLETDNWNDVLNLFAERM